MGHARLKLTEEQAAKVETEYKDGASLKELAGKLNCSIPTVSRLLKKRGVEIRARGRKKKNEAPPSFNLVEKRKEILDEAEQVIGETL